MESLQPELYTQTSTESVPDESSDGFDGEIEMSCTDAGSGNVGVGAALGELHLGVVYDFTKKHLEVRVIGARQLSPPFQYTTASRATGITARTKTQCNP